MSAGPDLDHLADLEEQRDFLLRSLDDLDRELAAGDIDPVDHRALKADYTARAAAVLRAIEEDRAALPARAPVARSRRVLLAAGAVAVALVLGVLVAQSSGERSVGDTATGSIRQTTSDQLARARLLVTGGRAADAVQLYDEVLDVDPDNREALAYKGWLLVLAGLVDEGAVLLDDAVAADPAYLDARFFRAFVRYRHLDDPQGALDDVRVVIANDPPPDMVPSTVALLRELEVELGLAEPEPETDGPPASDAPSSTRP